MASLLCAAAVGGTFFRPDWDFWMVLGGVGTVVFGSRFFVQWWATERHKRVVVPMAFWWLSLIGSGCMLIYGVHRQDLVFVFAYLFNWIPYVRNLMIGYRIKRAEVQCPACQVFSPGTARFCAQCGTRVELVPAAGAT